MKREIKFRAWTREGEWDDKEEKRQFIMIDGDSLCPFECEPFKDLLKDVDDEYYVMQFTGLKDKNGKEIYEGDIIHYEGLRKRNYTGPIVFKDGKFIAKDFYMTHLDDPYDFIEEISRVEVIGNIYENPELL